MKMNLRSLPVLALAVSAAFTACQKEDTVVVANAKETEMEAKAHNDDQNRVAANMDDVASEANVALEATAGFSGGRTGNTASFCGATAVADTANATRTITITYNGNDCGNAHSRTGTVVLSMPGNVRWRNPGAAITINYQNLKIKRLRDNQTITLNGTQTFTNVNGGLVALLALAPQQTVTHTLTSNNMSITFSDGTQRTWQVARKREFSYRGGVVMTVTGIGTSGSVTTAAEWGTNRFGKAFTTSVTQPIVVRQDCGFRITEGEVKHEGAGTATVKFGLNANGEPTGCPGTNSFFLKLTWAGANGASGSAILPY